jgi:class 3 adenylate cyclase
MHSQTHRRMHVAHRLEQIRRPDEICMMYSVLHYMHQSRLLAQLDNRVEMSGHYIRVATVGKCDNAKCARVQRSYI